VIDYKRRDSADRSKRGTGLGSVLQLRDAKPRSMRGRRIDRACRFGQFNQRMACSDHIVVQVVAVCAANEDALRTAVAKRVGEREAAPQMS